MNINDMTETAYKNGFEAGKKAADRDEYRRLKREHFSDEGEWLFIEKKTIFGTSVFCYRCSECGKLKDRGENWAYCPACGTKMKGGDGVDD